MSSRAAALAALAVALPFAAPAVSASAEPVPPPAACPDVEFVFARGTGEAPGIGGVGQSFLDAFRAQAAPRTVNFYAVDYPASADFQGGTRFAATVVEGIRDEADHITAVAAACPATEFVLGGFSQGAAVTGFTTVDRVPAGVPADLVPEPLPTAITDRVAAVVLFGTPSAALLGRYGAPAVEIGSRFADKTLQLCAPGDTICDGNPDGGANVAHVTYPFNGSTAEGAAYAVARL